MEVKEMCKCGEDTVYSEVLTKGLCLNCYHNQEEERKMMEIECRHDS